MSTLLLIDGHSQAYRAYFGMKTPLSTREGELTNAVFGFTRKLFSVLKEYRPEYVAVAFDLGDTWRHAEFEEYKATREHMPDDMRSQIERIQEVLTALNIPIITMPDYEADDVLGPRHLGGVQPPADVHHRLALPGQREGRGVREAPGVGQAPGDGTVAVELGQVGFRRDDHHVPVAVERGPADAQHADPIGGGVELPELVDRLLVGGQLEVSARLETQDGRRRGGGLARNGHGE